MNEVNKNAARTKQNKNARVTKVDSLPRCGRLEGAEGVLGRRREENERERKFVQQKVMWIVYTCA